MTHNHLKNTSINIVIFSIIDQKLSVLITETDKEKVQEYFSKENIDISTFPELRPLLNNKVGDYFSLPGGYINFDKDLKDAARNIVENYVGFNNIHLKQCEVFGNKDRVILGRNIAITYYAIVDINQIKIEELNFVKSGQWMEIDNFPDLIYDHKKIINRAIKKLREETQIKPIGRNILPQKFTLREYQDVIEAILGKQLDTGNFRRKIKNLDLVIETKETRKVPGQRLATAYIFNNDVYDYYLENNYSNF